MLNNDAVSLSAFVLQTVCVVVVVAVWPVFLQDSALLFLASAIFAHRPNSAFHGPRGASEESR